MTFAKNGGLIMQQTKMTLQELIDTAEARLVELNYSPNTTYIFHRCWLDLLAYAEERNEETSR